MTFGRDLKCDSCGQTETIRTTLVYRYALDDNQRLPGVAIPTWCFDCDGIREGEQLPTVERLSQLASELETNGLDERELKDKASFLRTTIDPAQEYDDELARRRAALNWRSKRRSPPRCLVCGGTNHSPIQWSDRGCEHPGCNGTFTTQLEHHSLQAIYWEVDAEGNRLTYTKQITNKPLTSRGASRRSRALFEKGRLKLVAVRDGFCLLFPCAMLIQQVDLAQLTACFVVAEYRTGDSERHGLAVAPSVGQPVRPTKLQPYQPHSLRSA